MDRKMHYRAEYAPFKDGIPYRKPRFTLGSISALDSKYRKIKVAGEGTWENGKGGNRTWDEKANEIAKDARPEWVRDVWKRLKKGPEPERITTCLWNRQPYPTGAV